MGQERSIVGLFRGLTVGGKVQEIQQRPASETCQTRRDDPISPPTPSRPKDLYQQDSKFIGLPLDMILTIFDLLEEAHDAVALSLACKGFYQHLFADARIRFENAGWHGRQQVQTMLEKDLPRDQVYCGFCRTFHNLDNDYRRTSCLENQHPRLSSLAIKVPGILTSKLTYLDARAMLNAILFGKPALLERKTSAGTTESPWTQTWDFRSIRRELLAMVTSTHSNYKPTSYKEEFTYSVCKHVHLHAKFPNMWVNRSELMRMFICPRGDYASGTCRDCHTDWEVRLKWSKGKVIWTLCGWEIEIHSWHQLGGLRSPSGPMWTRCAGEYVSPDRMLPEMIWEMFTSTYTTWHGHWSIQILGHGIQGSGTPIGPYQQRWKNAEKGAS